MWWCCGKRGKDAPGCKFSKHESKDDEEEAHDLDENDKSNYIKRLKCFVRKPNCSAVRTKATS